MTYCVGRVVMDLGNSAAVRTDGMRHRILLRISVPREYIGRKKIDSFPTAGAVDNFHPEKIQNIGLYSIRESGAVEPAYSIRNVLLDGTELFQNRRSIVNGKSVFHEEIRNRVDVTADSVCANLGRLSDGRAAAHEWIEDSRVRYTNRLIEQFEEISASGRERTDDHRTEDGAQSLRPPLVNMIDGPVYLLSPRLDLGNVAQRLERKSVVLDRSWATRDRKRKDRRSGLPQWELGFDRAERLYATRTARSA